MKGGYVDGFVLTVPKKNFGVYKKMASEASKIWKRFGALGYYECMANDMKPKFVTFTFPKMTKQKSSETVWFSFIIHKSRAHRDTVNKKVMAYFDKKYADKKDMKMPFDTKRMAYGGFGVIVA